mgnify:CR=1 FL=1
MAGAVHRTTLARCSCSLFLLTLAISCANVCVTRFVMASEESKTSSRVSVGDPSSYANTDEVVTQHISLVWNVDFATTSLSGSATLRCQSVCDSATKVIVDSRDLKVTSVEVEGAWGACCTVLVVILPARGLLFRRFCRVCLW